MAVNKRKIQMSLLKWTWNIPKYTYHRNLEYEFQYTQTNTEAGIMSKTSFWVLFLKQNIFNNLIPIVSVILDCFESIYR